MNFQFLTTILYITSPTLLTQLLRICTGDNRWFVI